MPSDHFRAYPRRPTRITLSAAIKGSAAPVRLVDLGMGGAGLKTDARLDVGARIDLVIQAPNRWDPLVIESRVAWTQGRRAGVAFEHRDDADVYALFELLGTQSFEG